MHSCGERRENEFEYVYGLLKILRFTVVHSNPKVCKNVFKVTYSTERKGEVRETKSRMGRECSSM